MQRHLSWPLKLPPSFGKAWAESITPENIRSGFRATGIYHFNPNAIPDVAYAPASNDTEVNFPSQSQTSETVSLADTAAPTNEDDEVNLLANTAASVNQNLPIIMSLEEATDDSFGLPLLDFLVTTNDKPVDLPFKISDDGMVDVSFVEADTCMSEITDKNALEVIESSLTPETLSKYCAAYISGTTIHDGIYKTWLMYKNKCTETVASPKEVLDQHFPLPKTKTSTKAKKNINNEHFVITANEVYHQKVTKNEKRKNALDKEARKVERERKKMKVKNLKVKKGN
ncbi:hypothetical protein ACF0H5_003309 [Mactra antiquata]